VRVADVGGEAFQDPERGPLAGGGDRGRHGVGLMVRVLASSMMGSRAVISAGAGCCRAERAGQRLTVFAEKGRVPRSVIVTGHVIGGDASEPHFLVPDAAVRAIFPAGACKNHHGADVHRVVSLVVVLLN
jgi:hypothetical protein